MEMKQIVKMEGQHRDQQLMVQSIKVNHPFDIDPHAASNPPQIMVNLKLLNPGDPLPALSPLKRWVQDQMILRRPLLLRSLNFEAVNLQLANSVMLNPIFVKSSIHSNDKGGKPQWTVLRASV